MLHNEIMLGPAPHLVYRTIGGMLDIFFFPGPYPEDVVRQYVALVGKPAFPPYWAFGYQVRFVLFAFLLNEIHRSAKFTQGRYVDFIEIVGNSEICCRNTRGDLSERRQVIWMMIDR
uniref:Glycoside hydrolase family 31 N-terminal domain-containing protein n=1 Tax=Parascaris equorum TaxID=6256 RepID=A0A914S609_PAREQ